VGTIQPSIRGHSLRDHGLYFDGLGHVSPDKDDFSTLLRDEVHGLLATLLVHISDNQFGPFSGKG
jgi:hypothetical protein